MPCVRLPAPLHGRRLLRIAVCGHLTEGERWTREQLEVLLVRRFSPPAVAGFLVASQRRAGEVRRARPELARRSRAWIAVGAAAYAGTCAVWSARGADGPPPLRPRTAAAWWTATWLMLDWHLGMVETQDGRPRNLAVADAMTLARVWMVPVALVRPTAPLTLAAFATDVLDGRLARASEPTRIGRDLEGLADSAFAAAALRGAVRRRWLVPAVAHAEMARLSLGFAYALGVYFGSAQRPDPTVTRAARVTTPVRMAGIAVAGAGRPRLAAAMVGGGAVWSVGAMARALVRGPKDRLRRRGGLTAVAGRPPRSVAAAAPQRPSR